MPPVSSDAALEKLSAFMGTEIPSTSFQNPKYVQLASCDDGTGLPAAFFEDPHVFKPKPGPRGEIHAWGIYPYIGDPQNASKDHIDEKDSNIPAYDGFHAMMRWMKVGVVYHTGPLRKPEDQFLDVILERKRQELARIDLGDMKDQDIIIKISLYAIKNKSGEPRIWRRFRVSAGMKVAVFQDKVLSPIMGWTRNFHCYTFTDFRDGSLYGPKDSGAIDFAAHINHVGYQYLPDDEYTIAHLFSKAGDRIGYLYDFGDKWYHDLEIEQVIPVGQSDGSVRILAGQGACPGENMSGVFRYRDFLKDYDNGTVQERRKKMYEILDAPNYKQFGKPACLLDPDTFDMKTAETNLAAALSSPNSVRSGAKKHHVRMTADAAPLFDELKGQKKGEKISRTHESPWGFWSETNSTRRDRHKTAVCAFCGKPGGDQELKACGGCRKMLYCSREHQRAHWKAVHKQNCSQEFRVQ